MVTAGERTRLVLVTGLDRTASDEVCDQLMRAGPGTVVVHPDLRAIGEGVVRRRMRTPSGDSTEILELAHGCVSCTLREGILPVLRELAGRPDVRRVVLHLDPVMEPEAVCWTLADGGVTDVLTTDAVVAVIDEGSWLADATGDTSLDELPDRGFGVTPDEERTLAQLAVGQVEFADAVVMVGRATDGWSAARLNAVLDRLAPGAPRAQPARTDCPRSWRPSPPPHAEAGPTTRTHPCCAAIRRCSPTAV